MRLSDFDSISAEFFHKRLKKATLLIVVVFAALILRLWFFQIINGTAYRTRSENNRIHLQTIPAFRGLIFDRNGQILVGNSPSYDLYTIPEEIQNRDRLLKSLNRLVGLDPARVAKKLANITHKNPFRPVCLKGDISRTELAVIETHLFNLPGVMIKVEPRRHYVSRNLASHLLGYLGEISEDQLLSKKYPNCKSGDLIGKMGVEWKWQHFLRGTAGGEQVEVDAAGRKIRTLSGKAAVPGANVHLTIDRNLQTRAESFLNNKSGAIVAIDPNNGEVLALASSPSFDPNLFVKGIDKSTWGNILSSREFPLQNRALSGQYPPGSVFKIIIALGGLEEGLIDPEEMVVCNGSYRFGNREYRCWKKHGHGPVSLHRALVESCDIYFYRMGQRLGVDKIANYSKIFGFGAKTGLDIRQENPGLIPTRAWKLRKWGVPWQAGETLSIAIGQSFVMVTPIQAAMFMSALCNGGVVYEPQITKWVGKAGSERLYESRPRIKKRVGIKTEHMDRVKRALIGVVNEARGTGSRARLKQISVAGKTGTAQVVALAKDEDSKGKKEVPREFRDHAWFVSFAPANNPKIALAIVVEHGGHGGSTAGPIAGELIKTYLKVQ